MIRDLEELLRWAAFGALLLILVPGQIYLQTHFYQSIGVDDSTRIAMMAMGGALCLVEAVALPLVSLKLQEGQGIRTGPFLLLALPLLLLVTFAADVGAITAHVQGDRDTRAALIAQREADRDREAELTNALSAAAAALPEAHRGKTSAALEIERDGLAGRIARAAAPSERWLRQLTVLDSALAMRRAMDRLEAERAELRRALTVPPPAPAHPQLQAFTMLAHALGFSRVTPEHVSLVIAIGFVLVVKLVLFFGFWIATPTALAHNKPRTPTAPIQVAPAPPVPVATPPTPAPAAPPVGAPPATAPIGAAIGPAASGPAHSPPPPPPARPRGPRASPRAAQALQNLLPDPNGAQTTGDPA